MGEFRALRATVFIVASVYPSPTLHTRSDEETLHWLALRLTPGLGARKTLDLLAAFRSPVSLFRASAGELAAAGLPPGLANAISSGCSFEEAARQHEVMKSAGILLLTFNDDLYPQHLKEIYDPPPVLFLKGRTELLNAPMMAVVGSRRASPYGAAVAEKISRDLALEGVVVVSGMARGIDTAAHKGALDASGGTVAVFGCGLDVIYPTENRKLAARIASEGLLVSEFPLGFPAYPQNFPIRNRIVSGLSAGVLVVEGAQYSGSSVTARLALDQNREVFAIPGPITAQSSFGPNLLIKQGAHLVQDVADIIEGLPFEIRRKLSEARSMAAKEGDEGASQGSLPLGPMTQIAAQVLEILQVETPQHLDILIDRLPDISSSEIIAALFDLELGGQVRQLPGRNFVKIWSV